jgi:hypothetical protein
LVPCPPSRVQEYLSTVHKLDMDAMNSRKLWLKGPLFADYAADFIKRAVAGTITIDGVLCKPAGMATLRSMRSALSDLKKEQEASAGIEGEPKLVGSNVFEMEFNVAVAKVEGKGMR